MGLRDWGLPRQIDIYKHAFTWEFQPSFFQLPFYCIFHLFCGSFHFISYSLIHFLKFLINISITVQLPHSNLKNNHSFFEDHNHPPIFFHQLLVKPPFWNISTPPSSKIFSCIPSLSKIYFLTARTSSHST